jgi:HrpA-like RNA helicase
MRCVRLHSHDTSRNMRILADGFASLAALRQRAGRAGRVRAGKCYTLVSEARRRTLPAHPMVEMLRAPLETLCLQVCRARHRRCAPLRCAARLLLPAQGVARAEAEPDAPTQPRRLFVCLFVCLFARVWVCGRPRGRAMPVPHALRCAAQVAKLGLHAPICVVLSEAVSPPRPSAVGAAVARLQVRAPGHAPQHTTCRTPSGAA